MKEYHIADWETFKIRSHVDDDTGPQGVREGMAGASAQVEETQEECLARLKRELGLKEWEVIYDPTTHIFDFARGEAVLAVKDVQGQVQDAVRTALADLTARIERLEGKGEWDMEIGDFVDKAPSGPPVDNKGEREGKGAGEWEIETQQGGVA